MEAYFIRHTWNVSVDDKTRNRMWRERRIFIHFPWDKSHNQRSDSRSTNPEDYEVGNKRAISALQRLASDGGYVCAHYVEQDKWLMGLVPPKSRVRLFSGKWRPEARPKGHNGWFLVRTRGNHRKYHHPTKPGTVTVAGHPGHDLHPKTLNSILRQAGLK